MFRVTRVIVLALFASLCCDFSGGKKLAMASEEPEMQQEVRRRMAVGGSFDQNWTDIDELVDSAASAMRFQTGQTAIREEEEGEEEHETQGDPERTRVSAAEQSGGRRRSQTDPFQARRELPGTEVRVSVFMLTKERLVLTLSK
eukprot:gb/GECG01000732.1/.p1 GENE.gb/GECG01000732.1/~~gb/GECG01000732.1/.p1  ORF type:complete len:144 (+),score=25.09 gb/GECG01000732.1/:1-432(+)